MIRQTITREKTGGYTVSTYVDGVERRQTWTAGNRRDAEATARFDKAEVIMPTCEVCGQRKKPIGRDAPAAASYCDSDCPGSRQDPQPGHYWPSEGPDRREAE